MAINTLLTNSQTPTLTWAAIANALQYEVQFATDVAFKTIIQDITGLLTGSVTPAALANAQKWYWRFRALLSNTLFSDQASTANSGSGNNLLDVAADTNLAQGFTPFSGNPIRRVQLSLKKVGAPASNVWVEIWTNVGGSPGAIIGAASATQACSGLTTSFANYTFDFTNPIPVTAGTSYFIVLRGGFSIDGTDYVVWEHDTSGSYTGGVAYKMNGSSTWSTNGTPSQIFTEYYYKWSNWQPVRSIWVNTAFAVTYAPSKPLWAFVDFTDTTDVYEFAVAPHYDLNPEHQRRSQVKNIQGDTLTEYVSTRDIIILMNGQSKGAGGSSGIAYVDYNQAAEMWRFFNKRKSIFLIGVTSYGSDNWERVWKVDFTDRPDTQPLAPGREDFFSMTLQLQESALS